MAFGLAMAAFLGGVVDAIAGGGGLITLPALLLAGFPPQLALGTNKGQSVFGSGIAMTRYRRAGLLNAARGRWTFPIGLTGALMGAVLVSWISPEALKPMILVLLVAVAGVLMFRPQSLVRTSTRPPARWAAGAIAFAIAAYDGFFGPGTGTFLILAFIRFLGDAPLRATAEAKVVNFASNLAAVAWFGLQGFIVWSAVLPMAVGQSLGSWLGAHLTLRHGDRLVRSLLFAVVVALVTKLAWDLRF